MRGRSIAIRDRSRFATDRGARRFAESSFARTDADRAADGSRRLPLRLAGDRRHRPRPRRRQRDRHRPGGAQPAGALQKRAIVWGAVGAIGVRSLMTVIVVWLLHIPGLLLAGGLLLLWIAYRLLLPDADGGDRHAPGAGDLLGRDADDRHRRRGDGARQRARRRRRGARQLPAGRRRPRHQRADRRLGQHAGAQGRRSLSRAWSTSAPASWPGPRSKMINGEPLLKPWLEATPHARAGSRTWRFRSSSAPASSGTIAASSRASMPGWRRRATRCRPAPARRRGADGGAEPRGAAESTAGELPVLERPRPRRRVAECAARRAPRDRRIPAPSRAAAAPAQRAAAAVAPCGALRQPRRPRRLAARPRRRRDVGGGRAPDRCRRAARDALGDRRARRADLSRRAAARHPPHRHGDGAQELAHADARGLGDAPRPRDDAGAGRGRRRRRGLEVGALGPAGRRARPRRTAVLAVD